MYAVNLGDVIGTIIYLILIVLMIAFIFMAFKRLINSKKEQQVINKKLDMIMQKLDEQSK